MVQYLILIIPLYKQSIGYCGRNVVCVPVEIVADVTVYISYSRSGLQFACAKLMPSESSDEPIVSSHMYL
jgi:hypothetical protein